ncbi:MAG: ABC transporter permease subunit [Clostridiales bacterium]|jgi:putative aldouronate transport system permease protein|nr:ABC transporter permease subunit [Clostridiales bacterium]
MDMDMSDMQSHNADIGGRRAARRKKRRRARYLARKHWQLYLLLAVPVALLITFKYVPIYGVQIAFRDYSPAKGFSGSDWVGLKHFINFFSSHQFGRLLSNTLTIGFFTLLANIPAPIVLALAINECRWRIFGKTVQMVTYAPYFISTVVVTSMIMQFLAMRGGMLNGFRDMLGLPAVNLMADPSAFPAIYVISDLWQRTGYGAVIYLAALASVSPDLYEAARIDGATIFQKIRYIDLPSLMPMATMLLIMNCGSVINVGYEKVYLLQNQLNIERADVINTYVYRMGITSAQYSYSAAIGLFNSVVSILLVVAANQIAKKASETSLF